LVYSVLGALEYTMRAVGPLHPKLLLCILASSLKTKTYSLLFNRAEYCGLGQD